MHHGETQENNQGKVNAAVTSAHQGEQRGSGEPGLNLPQMFPGVNQQKSVPIVFQSDLAMCQEPNSKEHVGNCALVS